MSLYFKVVSHDFQRFKEYQDFWLHTLLKLFIYLHLILILKFQVFRVFLYFNNLLLFKMHKF